MTAPVAGSGSWPAWMARVSKSMPASLDGHRCEAELTGQPRERPLERLGAAEAALRMPRLRASASPPPGRPSGRPGRRCGRRRRAAARSSRSGAPAPACRPRSGARNPSTRSANGRSQSRLSNGEISTAPAGRAASRSASAANSTGGPPSSTSARRSSPAATTSSTCGRIRAVPPRSRQCSTIPASVSAPRPRTARTTSRRSTSSSSGTGRPEHGVGQHPLGQVVHPLEPLPAGDHELARAPQRLEHPLGRLQASTCRADPLPSKSRDPSGPALADRAHHLVGQLRLALDDRPPPRMRSVAHEAAHQRPQIDRQQARLVRPVLEQAAGPRAGPTPCPAG